MMVEGRNEGIIVRGGTVNAGAMAAGSGATAHNVAADLTARGQVDVARRLEELVRQLEAHADQVPGAEQVRDDAQTVTEELAKDQPDRGRLERILSRISDSVGSVSSLTQATNALLDAIRAF
ncbi:DUF5955 family protein [Geodermatophilus maliterrae]|uniref:DUF5955 family protein n=1 Tax=Geodermatophilus maliterrae TaxID=3162531 RepID=A0ABV3XDW2_9ACTN